MGGCGSGRKGKDEFGIEQMGFIRLGLRGSEDFEVTLPSKSWLQKKFESLNEELE